MFSKNFNQTGSTFGSAFGQATQQNTSTFGSSTFGNPPASFPQATGAFGVSSQSNNIFGSTTSTAPAFGGFQQQQQPQQASGVFGQQATPAFGATQPFKSSFNFSAASQPQQTATQQNLFSSNAGTANRGFGSFTPSTNTFGSTSFGTPATGENPGSSIAKYQPTNSTDTLVKNGQQNNISTRQHCITAMKEYENKSLEEIRFEDYSANRKGAVMGVGVGVTANTSIFSSPQQQQQPTSQMNLFGTAQPAQQQTTSIFGAPQQQENKNPFGQTTFGQQNSFLNTTTTTDFGAKPFGAVTNTFGATDNNNSIFGNKPAFGAAPTSQSSVFGTQTSTANTSLFGNTNNAFAAPAQQPLAAAPTSSAFQVGTNTGGFGTFGSTLNNTSTNLFGAKPNTTTLTNFNATPAFGVSTQNAFPTFNANTTTSSSLFNTQAAKPNTTFSGFTGLNTTLNNPPANQSFFSSNVNKPTGLGTQLGKPANSLFSMGQPAMGTIKPTLGQPSLAPQSSSSKTLIHQQLLSKVSSPFGENPLFKDIKLKANEDKTTQKLLPSINASDSLFKVNTKSDSKQTFVRNVLSKKSLFEGLEENDNTLEQCFNIKSNNRRLLLAPKAATPNKESPANKSKIVVVSEEQENETVNINKRVSVENKQDSWLCPEKFKETGGGKFKEVSFENTMNELVPNKDLEKESTEVGAFEENVNESKVLLTRPGYFTIPSVNELNSYVRNGQCIIPNFTIGRTGYGNIYFNEEMDVYGLNLDVLVHFRHKEVTVYPDETNKPPIGQGLNREAQVTLDQVWPNDKTTQNYIKDIDQLIHLNFEGKLRRICEKKGVRFIEYRPETGSWVFKVKHFSKYGYNDSDDEDDIAPKEGVPNRQAILVPSKEVKAVEQTVRSDISAIEKSNKDENENSMFYGSITSTIGKINKTNTRKLQLMKATYFVDDHMSDNEEMVDVSSNNTGLLDLTTSKTTKKSTMETRLEHERPAIYVPEVCCNLRFDFKLSALLSKSCLSDIALLNMNRFKCNFGRNNVLVVQSLLNSNQYSNPRRTVNSSLNIVSINSESEIPNQMALEFLKINFKHSERFEQENSECPVYKKRPNSSIVQDYLKAINLNGNSKFDLQSFLKSVWSLCSVLWSDLQNEKQWCNNESMVRRTLFTKWLEDNCNDDSALAYTDELLNLVLKHKISEACDLAMKNSDLTMALLLSQASNRKNFRDIVEDQLSLWNSSGVDKYITENRLKLIMATAGVPIMESHYGTISLFENKDWLQVLSIQHWYVNMPTCSIEKTVHSFDSLLANEAVYKSCLRPTFYKPHEVSDDVFDARYHILNLYSNTAYSLEKVINNICNTPHVMDYFTSWMLLDLFKLLGYKHCSLISERKVQENVALQLESAGHWEWSIYLLLHIDSKQERETAIQNVLTRNIDLSNKESLDKQKFVIDDLGVPRHWVDIAKYYKSRQLNNHWFEFKYLLRANKNVMALQTFYSHMAPHAIINGNFMKISILLQYLDKLFSNKTEGFSYWEVTGQALFNFVNLLRTSKKYIIEDNIQLSSSIMNIKRDFEIIISKIKRMPTNSVYDVLCQTEICQNLHLLLNNLYSGSSHKNKVYYEMLIILEGLVPYDLLKI